MHVAVACFILLLTALSASVSAARTAPDEELSSKCDAVPRDTWHAAETGNIDAQVIVGHSIVSGECGASDELLQRGLRWLHAAAETQHLGAIVSLALAYHVGDVISSDEKLAITYYRQAAEAEIVDAQHTLGILLISSGTPENRDEGFFWLGAAASQGDGVSAAYLRMLHEKGMHGVASDECLALDWYEASLLLDAPVPVENFIAELPEAVRSNC